MKKYIANLAGKQNIKMAFPQFAELWKLIDLLVRKDFRQANLVYRLVNKWRNCGWHEFPAKPQNMSSKGVLYFRHLFMRLHTR